MTGTALVTGAAGFVGSHLTERLLEDGWWVKGVDCFTDTYARSTKEQNLAKAKGHARFSLEEVDLATGDLREVVTGSDVVFHLAGQAGVRSSWGAEFEIYTARNILATQRLLEVAKAEGLGRLVYASSSSIYGDTTALPVTEDTLPVPVSPYGVSKLAAEYLCRLYCTNYGVPTVSVRYFTVYGPRQRPDMAFHRLIRAILNDEPFPLYGDGKQTRDFTFVGDAVEATIRAASAEPGSVFNVGGGSRVTLSEVIAMVEELVGKEARIDRRRKQAGDVRHTWADTSRIRDAVGFEPQVNLREGLGREVAWLRRWRA
ncbi:MAG: NAD-dependent epimerase/dehydratase family protein [Anaerolineae bacterium]|nr:NAD-dependent epimerase/dehydratase family protein [Anaerolineae bacterium]